VNQESGVMVTTFRPLYPVIVPAAIAALVAPGFAEIFVRYQERRDALYLPVSSAPDQPHPLESNSAPVATTAVEWSASGTNTSAAVTTTSLAETTLILPFDAEPAVVESLRLAGLTVEVSPAPRNLSINLPRLL
jgi:hypothetical protein